MSQCIRFVYCWHQSLLLMEECFLFIFLFVLVLCLSCLNSCQDLHFSVRLSVRTYIPKYCVCIWILRCCKFYMSYGTLSVYLDKHVVIDLCLVMNICYKGHINENPNNERDNNFIEYKYHDLYKTHHHQHSITCSAFM